jgi:hypothetical protein
MILQRCHPPGIWRQTTECAFSEHIAETSGSHVDWKLYRCGVTYSVFNFQLHNTTPMEPRGKGDYADPPPLVPQTPANS